MNSARPIYSIGDCPACPGFGPILILISLASSEPVFYCPACATAWASPPDPPGHLDIVQALAEVAPGGVRLPTRDEIKRLFAQQPHVLDYRDWAKDLDAVLAQ